MVAKSSENGKDGLGANSRLLRLFFEIADVTQATRETVLPPAWVIRSNGA
jgi:hypothetical protein